MSKGQTIPKRFFAQMLPEKYRGSAPRWWSASTSFFHRPHEDLFQRTGGWHQRLNFTVLGPNQVQRLIDQLAGAELKIDQAVFGGHGRGLRSQLVQEILRRLRNR